MEFTGKTALVTGAATGIGRAVAIKFAQNGANVVLVDINSDKLESVKTEIKAYTQNVMALTCDISNETAVYEAVREATGMFSRIDILINNAAVWRCWDSFVNTATEEWRKFMDVNILGTVYFTKAVLPAMLENSYGKIVNVASVAGVYGIANMVHYSATKGAVIAMTRALNPDMDYYEKNELSFLGRTGTDNENANLICFLASDEASYIAGQNIQIDGCRKKQ